ncbi:MAG TPA: RNA 2',3'-cyclic phosphodiesterase [Rhodanobacteraceae bacterium]|nr:RNA 2',3'-cyclic phosphodiesterase [Rhodanobacteraceae bacterium]
MRAGIGDTGVVMASERLFLAVFPDAAVAGELAALAAAQYARHGLPGKPLAAARLHLTLQFLGDFEGLPAERVAAVKAASARVRLPAFELVLDELATFAARRRRAPLVLRPGQPCRPLQALRAQLDERLCAEGLLPPDRQPFEPHLTLGYAARAVAPEPVVPISWRVHEFVLVRSLLGQSRYQPLARWPLA